MPVQREWEVRLRARVQQSVGVVRTYDAPDPVAGFIQQVLKEAGRDQKEAALIKIVKVGAWVVRDVHIPVDGRCGSCLQVQNGCRFIMNMMSSFRLLDFDCIGCVVLRRLWAGSKSVCLF